MPAAPAVAAKLGAAFRVSADGAQADVTLNAIHYSPVPSGDPTSEFAVLDVTIVGQSDSPFRYDENEFAFQYADGADPYHPDSTNIWGVTPDDWVRFSPALRTGAVRIGQRVRGTVPLRVEPSSQILITMSRGHSTMLVEWLTTSAGR